MKRPPCPKCKGYLILTEERDRTRVIKCVNCGWRKYPREFPPGHDYDGCIKLLREVLVTPDGGAIWDTNKWKEQEKRLNEELSAER